MKLHIFRLLSNMAYGTSLFLNRASSSHTAVDKNEAQPNLVQFSTACGPIQSLHCGRSQMYAGPKLKKWSWIFSSFIKYLLTNRAEILFLFYFGRCWKIMTCIMTKLCQSLHWWSECWFKKKNLWTVSFFSVVHSCNIKTLINSPINMLVPFCFTPADDGKEAIFYFLFFFFSGLFF